MPAGDPAAAGDPTSEPEEPEEPRPAPGDAGDEAALTPERIEELRRQARAQIDERLKTRRLKRRLLRGKELG